jgi:hypothetical protein
MSTYATTAGKWGYTSITDFSGAFWSGYNAKKVDINFLSDIFAA